MDIEAFRSAANRVRAEQVLQEKAASARAAAAVDLATAARAALADDPELLKIAARLCAADPLGFYVKLGGKFNAATPLLAVDPAPVAKVAQFESRATVKLAEPPPPPGMSVKEWDKVLSKGPSKPVKTAQLQLPPGLQKMAGSAPPSGISAATWAAVQGRGRPGT